MRIDETSADCIGGQIDGVDDSVLDELEAENVNENPVNKKLVKPITIISTNARSLCPKIDSLIDCMEEMDSVIGIISETWLADGPSLEADIADLRAGAGIGLICRNRDPNAVGVAHGGIVVTYNVEACSVKRLDLDVDNPDRIEVLAAVASLRGYSRKMIVIACYIPPRLRRGAPMWRT